MTRPRLGTVLAAIVVVGTVVLWAYLFLIADPDVPDQLEDRSFSDPAQELCAEAQARIDDLPPAQSAGSPEERAIAVDEANGILTALVADLREIAPTEGDDGRFTRLWLEDWDTYLGDRARYVEDLEAGENAELLVTAREGRQITVTIDRFALVNDMPDCQVPLDA